MLHHPVLGMEKKKNKRGKKKERTKTLHEDVPPIMATEWISIKCALGVCVCVCKSRGKKKKKRKGGLAQSLAVSGSPGRGGGAVASEVAYQQCAQARGRVTECVRRSGRGWEASFKARCSSWEGGLFYDRLLFGTFWGFFCLFFFPGKQLQKKIKKKKKATDT